ncbi:MAG TPA: hypothetical protein VEW71_00130 [Allosphingosinicella sp.]|nr:hypothetical protein [Allosphingosinicella sp.]
MKVPPPLRFLALVVGLWICGRAAMLAPGWWTEAQPPAVAALVSQARAAEPAAERPVMSARPLDAGRARIAGRLVPPVTGRADPVTARAPFSATPGPASPPIAASPVPGAEARATPILLPRSRRWSVSAWLLIRDESGRPTLAPGGTLGGSQAGARVLYRLGGGLALSGRLYAPLGRTGAAEAGAGLDWRPSARLPIHLLAERRQAIGSDGRSAFAATLYGGAGRDLARGLRIDAYGQAGLVGVRARDPFIDGSVRVFRSLGPVEIGGGAWGAAQPGVSRLDAGPSASWRLPVRGANFRLQADWRFRIAGDAVPGSGPALILAADF